MNHPWSLLMGIAATVLASLVGLILVPNWQLRAMRPVQVVDPVGRTVSYPAPLDRQDEAPGRRTYIAMGCLYCHSQQVRPADFGYDIARGWGERRSLARDYLFQDPPLLGTMRTGPDVTNIGQRQPSDAWHHLHLFDARIVSEGSIMPPFKFLYEVVHKDPGWSGYALPAGACSEPTWIVPSRAAADLVRYLRALRQDYSLDEVQ